MTTLFTGARVIDAGGVRDSACVVVDDDRIAAVLEAAPGRAAGARVVDLAGCDLIPGLVDVHSDCLERLLHPRPSMELPMEGALIELDGLALTHGITTNLLCVSLEEDATKFRSIPLAARTIDALEAVRPHLRGRWLVHLRVDVTGAEAVRRAEELALHPSVVLVSYMDHTPGQGQYATTEQWMEFYEKGKGADTELAGRLAQKLAAQDHVERRRAEVAAAARAGGALLAAHDDDSAEAVQRSANLGAVISEFPVSLEAARAAQSTGQGIVMGAPNARRGSSHLANLSAREALGAGVLDALASDYHPPSLLAAAYQLAREDLCPIADAVALVSSGPAGLAGLGDRGRLRVGSLADMVAVEHRGDTPVVVQTWVGGRPALGHAQLRRPLLEGARP